jgi:inner membrane transporter RhtA
VLPATATVVGVLVLTQIPGAKEIIGVVLVVAGVALHQERPPEPAPPDPPPCDLGRSATSLILK